MSDTTDTKPADQAKTNPEDVAEAVPTEATEMAEKGFIRRPHCYIPAQSVRVVV